MKEELNFMGPVSYEEIKRVLAEKDAMCSDSNPASNGQFTGTSRESGENSRRLHVPYLAR